MYEELLAAIAKLTVAVNGVSATLAIILVVLVMKETNSSSAVRSLRHYLENIDASIGNLRSSLAAEIRQRRRSNDE